MEQTKLFNLIKKSTQKSYLDALNLIGDLSADEIKLKCEETQNTYLHQIVLRIGDLFKRNAGNVTPAIPVLYKLVLHGCDVNAQNSVGNTCLHMACFRPHGEKLSQHLIRLGADPGIFNKAGCRVIHQNSKHNCWMVRGQKSAKCSIWMAVQREDGDCIEEYMRSWCRVMTRRRRKSLLDIAYDTGSFRTVERILRYRTTNELVVAALACDLGKVQELSRLRSDKCDLTTKDYSQSIPKPLIAELLELGTVANKVIQLLRNCGADDEKAYLEAVEAAKTEFETARFYNLVEEMTEESLIQAWQETHQKKFNINAVREDKSSYLHYIVEKYHACTDVHLRRVSIRLMYKLVLEGIMVQQRNIRGETVLITAYTDPPDRVLLDHLIQMGVDSSIRSRTGLCLAINTYATRGELLLQPLLNRAFMPGLWVAVEDNDMERVTYWLSNLCRVNTSKGGRTLMELAKDMGHKEVAALLEEHFHETEFVTAVMAADIDRMKHYLAMGNGVKKVNSCYSHFFAGYTIDRKTEFVVRPVILNAMEYATAEVSALLIKFGARLDVQYEECAPCSPAAFWAFRDDIQASVTMAISQAVDVSLRDERGKTPLHSAVKKRDRPAVKKEIIQVLLDRGANVAATDMSGQTARDLCDPKSILRQVIDDFVLNLCYIGEYDRVEQLIIEGYQHILDINDSVRHKTAKDLAYLRYYKELLELLDEIPKYQEEARALHKAVSQCDMKGLIRMASEKRLAFSVDSRGRNILHIAVLFQHPEMIAAICEQFPALITMGDNCLRNPVHYAVSLRDGRATLSVISTINTVDLSVRDANNMSVLDYIEQVERPVPAKLKTRGRRVYNYQPRNLIEKEMAETNFDDDLEEETTDTKA